MAITIFIRLDIEHLICHLLKQISCSYFWNLGKTKVKKMSLVKLCIFVGHSV